MVLARRMSHRRDHLQADLTDLRELVNCRRAAEGRYVRDLQEMRFELEERREFGDDVKTGERVLAGGGVARYLRDEIEKVRRSQGSQERPTRALRLTHAWSRLGTSGCICYLSDRRHACRHLCGI